MGHITSVKALAYGRGRFTGPGDSLSTQCACVRETVWKKIPGSAIGQVMQTTWLGWQPYSFAVSVNSLIENDKQLKASWLHIGDIRLRAWRRNAIRVNRPLLQGLRQFTDLRPSQICPPTHAYTSHIISEPCSPCVITKYTLKKKVFIT